MEIKRLLFLLPFTASLILKTSALLAQPGTGSATVVNGYRTSAAADSTFEYAETLYIGPGAVWDINGVTVIYSRYIWIAPAAQISGNGTLILADPAENPFYTGMMPGATIVDGNNSDFINLNMVHRNPGNIVLADIPDPGFGTVNPSGPQAAAFRVGKDFSFDVNDGDILLNGNDLVLGANATISNYSADRMVVTGNSISGHMVKENTTANTFIFPVGIAEQDYTPVSLSGSNSYYVSVTDYDHARVTIAAVEEGMDRAWHIYGGPATGVTLQHNSPGTDGTAYTDANAFITRYLGEGKWSTALSPEYVSRGIHSNTTIMATGIPLLADAAWLTKTSDRFTPLPLTLLDFNAVRAGTMSLLNWAAAGQTKGFSIEQSTDGSSWNTIGFVPAKAEYGNHTLKQDYHFTDEWPANGSNHYRLKQVFPDASYAYSEVRTLRFDQAPPALSLYPNPLASHINISGLQQEGLLDIYNTSGQLLKRFRVSPAVYTVDISDLLPGPYHMLLTAGSGEVLGSYKVIKNR